MLTLLLHRPILDTYLKKDGKVLVSPFSDDVESIVTPEKETKKVEDKVETNTEESPVTEEQNQEKRKEPARLAHRSWNSEGGGMLRSRSINHQLRSVSND